METEANAKVLREEDSLAVAEEAAFALYRKKGLDIKLFHVEENTVIADYYVICTGRSSTQLHALADEAVYRLGLVGLHAHHIEGRDGGEWLLVDFGTVLIHIFSRDARDYYHLERLLPPTSEVDLQAKMEEWQNKLGTGEEQ